MKASRLPYYFIFISILIGIVWILSSVFQYFHTGAKPINKYDLGLNQLAFHQPTVNWLKDDKDIKGTINPYLRKDIESAYLDAWGILNLSIKHKTDLGLAENFTEKKVKQIAEQLDSRDSILREDKVHNLKLHFISYDKQVVSFTDRGMQMETTIKSLEDNIYLEDKSNYKVLMTLNDGKWRINKMLRE